MLDAVKIIARIKQSTAGVYSPRLT